MSLTDNLKEANDIKPNVGVDSSVEASVMSIRAKVVVVGVRVPGVVRVLDLSLMEMEEFSETRVNARSTFTNASRLSVM